MPPTVWAVSGRRRDAATLPEAEGAYLEAVEPPLPRHGERASNLVRRYRSGM